MTSFGIQSGTKLLHAAHLNTPKVIDRRKAFTGTFNRTEGIRFNLVRFYSFRSKTYEFFFRLLVTEVCYRKKTEHHIQ